MSHKAKETNQPVVSTDSKSVLNDKKLYIETYGCQMNSADSEVVASIMQMDGFALTENITEADVIFANTCSIRENAEQKVIQRIKYFQSLKKKKKNLVIGIIGCMAERVKEELITEHKVNLVVGPDAYLDIPNLVGSVEKGEKAINQLSDMLGKREIRDCGQAHCVRRSYVSRPSRAAGQP